MSPKATQAGEIAGESGSYEPVTLGPDRCALTLNPNIIQFFISGLSPVCSQPVSTSGTFFTTKVCLESASDTSNYAVSAYGIAECVGCVFGGS